MTQEMTYFQGLKKMLIAGGKIRITETIKSNFKMIKIESTHEDFNQELWDLQNFKYTELKIKGEAEHMIGDEYINFQPMSTFMRTRNTPLAFYHSVAAGSIDMVELVDDCEKIIKFVYSE